MSSSLLQEMKIKDAFHRSAILVAIDELCSRNPKKVRKNIWANRSTTVSNLDEIDPISNLSNNV